MANRHFLTEYLRLNLSFSLDVSFSLFPFREGADLRERKERKKEKLKSFEVYQKKNKKRQKPFLPKY